jgi:penicillin V acylase-like amidase (Ntn superfamily)
MCTRIFNNFNKKFLTTARNMDWATQMATTVFAFRIDNGRPVVKSGTSIRSKNTLVWTAQYHSIVTMVASKINVDDSKEEEKTVFGASDGINSKGLVANLLYDSNATYRRTDESSCKDLDVLRWVQFVLDTCCSVEEVVHKFNKDAPVQIQLIGGKVPGSESKASVHLAISDVFRDSAIIEVVQGQFKIYHNKKFRVMTNEPSYDKQIELNQFWRWQWSRKNNFPSNTIPGGTFPSDRFARASYYLNHLHKPVSTSDSLTQSKSVVMNVSVPVNFNSKLKKYPNISQTLWTTVADHNELTYYFCNARTIGDIWMDLKKVSLFPSSVSKLIIVSEIREKGELTFINKPLYAFQNENFIPTTDPFIATNDYNPCK